MLDFENGHVLQITGSAEPLFNVDDPVNATGGTQRFLVFHIDEWLQHALPSGVETEFLDRSPFNPRGHSMTRVCMSWANSSKPVLDP